MAVFQIKETIMDFKDLVLKRQSCRKYLSKPVEQEKIDLCLEAARNAPSACNSQPWRFIVESGAEKDKLAQEAFGQLLPRNSFAKEAPVLVVAVMEKGSFVSVVGGCLMGVQFALFDIGMACEHFMLQAAELGLGTCCLGVFNAKNVEKQLGLSKDQKAAMMISVGYAADEMIRPKLRKTATEMSGYFKS